MHKVPYENQPPAVTKPGEQWALNGFNMSQVIIVRDGPDANGRHYIDRRHQVIVGDFKQVRDAAAAVQAFNVFNEIVDVVNDWRNEALHPDERAAEILEDIDRILTRAGR